MESISQVFEQNFTEGKALRDLCSFMHCGKLRFVIREFEK